MTPDPQTVYRGAEGRLLFYVRTEQRSGRDRPEHLFVTTRERVVFELWTTEVPPDAELIVDAEGRRQAREAQAVVVAADTDREIVLTLLKRACEWLPAERANEIRVAWREAWNS